MGLLSKEQIRELIEERQLVTAEDVKDTLQEMLEAELDTELGYPKNGNSPETSSNRRNGHTKKSVRSEYGDLELEVPDAYLAELAGIMEQFKNRPRTLEEPRGRETRGDGFQDFFAHFSLQDRHGGNALRQGAEDSARMPRESPSPRAKGCGGWRRSMPCRG